MPEEARLPGQGIKCLTVGGARDYYQFIDEELVANGKSAWIAAHVESFVEVNQ